MKQSIINLASELVRIPSRAGIDPNESIIDFLGDWLSQHHFRVNRLHGTSDVNGGLYLHLKSNKPGPVICLNACLDTAPFGNENAWHYSPTAAVIEKGRFYGRGSADSKIAVAIFSHLATAFRDKMPNGELYVVFDADEHTGEFQSFKNFLRNIERRPNVVLLGYPGNSKLIVGSRGFLRADVTVYGLSAHSGSGNCQGFNAVLKMAQLINSLYSSPLPQEHDPFFSVGPKVTVTEVKGGEGFSVVPDLCCCKIDFRLTPNVNSDIAAHWIKSVVNYTDEVHRGPMPSSIDWKSSWPAYRLSVDHPLVNLFLGVAQEVFGRSISPVVSGPSNIGNYLASKGIPTLSGFGVSYSNIHATDESIEIETVMPVYETYYRVVERILSTKWPTLNKNY